MNMEETAPTPSASSNVLGKGFNTLDYILCLSYLALIILVIVLLLVIVLQ